MTQAMLFDRPKPVALADDWASLRHFQRDCCEAVIAGFEENRSQLIVLATGLGKSVVAGALARYWLRHGRGNVMMIANRNELVQQGAGHLQRMCGEVCEIEQGPLQASRKARLVMASADTIKQKHRLDRFGKDHFGLVIADECFPAGTLVDGVPIERVAEGDLVSCVNHATGLVDRRPVTSRFSRLAENTWTLHIGATTLECTGNHPVYVKRGESLGYVQAERVVPGDLCCLRVTIRTLDSEIQPQASELLDEVSIHELQSSDGGDQPPLQRRIFQENDREQSHGADGSARQDGGHAARDWAWPESAPGQRARSHSGRVGGGDGFRVANECRRADTPASGLGVPPGVQARHRESGIEDRDRSGWVEPLGIGAPGAGREEREILAWVRVDRVARNEPTSPGGTRVYNLEVEGCHTYFANDTLIHNCHHFVDNTYSKTLDFFTGAKVLGLTATPDRADERALGQVFDNVAYVRDILAGIEDGYLVPISGRQVELGEIQLDGLAKVAGDLAKGQLDEVMVRAVEGVVHKTLELERDRRAIAFWPGIKSAEYAMERFNALEPGSTCFIHGGTEENERKRLVAGFRSGAIKRLMNVGIAIEGFDAPATSLIIQARPTLSRMFYAQTVGRGTRVLPGTVEHILGAEGAAERRAAVAASAKPTCIAEGQRVLTDVGLVPIEQVTTAMRVWDGCNFVSHCGIVLRGQRITIEYAGLRATADHRVWTQEGWKTFGECSIKQIPISVTGDGGKAIRETQGCLRGGGAKTQGRHASCVDGVRDVRGQSVEGSLHGIDWHSWLPRLWAPSAGTSLDGEEIQSGQAAMLQSKKPTVLRLWGPGNRVSLRFSAGYVLVGHRASRAAQKTTDRPHRQQRALRARQPALVKQLPELFPYEATNAERTCAQVPAGASGDKVCRLDAPTTSCAVHVRGDSRAVLSALGQTEGRVWDILDCGPLHRFTVEGLLVHNCMVLDFVGNATKHSLMAPEDLLGGDYELAEVELAKKKAKSDPGGDVKSRLEEARRELAAVAAAVRSKVQANVRNFDPFAVLDMDLTSTTREDLRWGRQAPTEKQLEALDKMKVPKAALKNISQREAQKLLAERNRRHDAGLSTYAQLAHLKKYGLDNKDVTFRGASTALTYVSQQGWNPAKVDLARLTELAMSK